MLKIPLHNSKVKAIIYPKIEKPKPQKFRNGKAKEIPKHNQSEVCCRRNSNTITKISPKEDIHIPTNHQLQLYIIKKPINVQPEKRIKKVKVIEKSDSIEVDSNSSKQQPKEEENIFSITKFTYEGSFDRYYRDFKRQSDIKSIGTVKISQMKANEKVLPLIVPGNKNAKMEQQRDICNNNSSNGSGRILSEEERVSALNKLIESKKEILTLFEKMPITKRTNSVLSRQAELEKKLEEVEEEVIKYSKKQVFIKS